MKSKEKKQLEIHEMIKLEEEKGAMFLQKLNSIK
jgi:hypothetical protein